MRWLALACGVLFVALVVVGLRAGPDEPPRVAAVSPAPQAAAPAAAREPAPAIAPARLRVVLRGVMHLGDDNPLSEAMLSVEGRPARAFRRGEVIDDGWSLEAIRPDHVFLTREGLRERLTVAASAAQGTPVAVPASGAPRNDQPLPGFARGGPPPAALSLGEASERNRRFLQERQTRASAAR